MTSGASAVNLWLVHVDEGRVGEVLSICQPNSTKGRIMVIAQSYASLWNPNGEGS